MLRIDLVLDFEKEFSSTVTITFISGDNRERTQLNNQVTESAGNQATK